MLAAAFDIEHFFYFVRHVNTFFPVDNNYI